MKLKNTFFYTLREDSRDEDSISGNLLVKAGYIKKTSAGVYMMLPLGLRVQNKIDRFNLVIAMINHLPSLGNKGAFLVQKMKDKLVEHKTYIHDVGIDMPEVAEWQWSGLK